MKELSRYSPDIYVFGNRELAGRNRSMTSPEWYIGFGASMTLFVFMMTIKILTVLGMR